MSPKRKLNGRRNARSWAEHARLINAAWQLHEDAHEQKVRAIVTTGRRLQDARDELGYRKYGKLFTAPNGVKAFDQDKAERLRKIAANPALTNSAHARKLPAHWYTLFVLSAIPTPVLNQLIADGVVHRDLERSDAERLVASLQPKPRGYLQDLIGRLEQVEPAVAINGLIPIMTCFWLTGDQLVAFNGNIALAVPFATDFRGAVPGKLLRLLKVASLDRDLQPLAKNHTHLLINDAHTRMKLGMLPPKFLHVMPARQRNSNGNASAMAALIAAIEHCLISVGTDTSRSEHLGITLEPENDRVMLYATDEATISRACVQRDGLAVAERAIIPAAFCQQMLRLYADLGPAHKGDVNFEVSSRHVSGQRERYALFTAGDVALYGRLLETRTPLAFPAHVRAYLPPGYQSQLIEIPARLRTTLDLHRVFDRDQRSLTTLTVRSGELHLWSKLKSDEIETTLALPGHADIAVRVDAQMLQRAPHCNAMVITSRGIVMSKGDWLYLVACSEPPGE
jgi:hypothetical protein